MIVLLPKPEEDFLEVIYFTESFIAKKIFSSPQKSLTATEVTAFFC